MELNKIRLFRQSGTPVLIENNEKFRSAYAACVEKVQAKHPTNMKVCQRYLNKCYNVLLREYNPDYYINAPTSQAEFADLFEQFGPILLSKLKNTEEVVGVIMDMSYGALDEQS